MSRAVFILVMVAACGSSAPPTGPVVNGKVVASNVLRSDYAGSATCGDCHADIASKWAKSPMHNMTRDAATAVIKAPFDGATLTVGGESAMMFMQDGARFVRVQQAGKEKLFRVTKVVGGRYREDFVGLDVTGDPDPLHASIGVERVLPATFVFSTQSWRYKGYSVMVKERPELSVRAVWSTECIPCHNTLPLATMLYDDLYGPDLPAYQGKVSDRLLPRSLIWTAHSLDDTKLASVLHDEIKFLGGEQPADPSLHAALPAAAIATETYLDGPKLVEVGIGCEACHNGAKQHVADPTIKPTYAATSDVLAVVPPGGGTGTRAQWINRTCAKCHTVLFTRYPYTWEGGERKHNPGGSTTNSGEGRDFQLGGCASQMACTTCHDPHAEDPAAALAELATTKGNKVCVTCHGKYESEAAQLQHSHHQGGSAGSACISCHMPKKNMGLDYHLVRYHRIGSPNDKNRVAKDRPIECALCHAQKSVEELTATMEKWYGKRIDREALKQLYGPDLSVPAMPATLERGKPHEQAVAIATLGLDPDANARAASIALIAPQLAHPYPLVRWFAQRALEQLTGEKLGIDLNASAATLSAQASAWLAAHPGH
ncbi:MAG TPA: cytochrome c3 family protein [Kofleriaceae bacterium]